MLKLQRKRGTKGEVKDRSQQACQIQPQGKSKIYTYLKDKEKLKVTYSPLSGKRRMGSCFPLTASCSAGRSSVYRGPRSGRLGLAGRLEFGRTFLDWCKDIYHFNLLFPTWRIDTCVPIPSLILLIPFKDGGLVLFPGICQHGLGRQEQPRIRRDNHIEPLRRNERETTTTCQLLLKRGYYGLLVSMHSRGAKALPLRVRNCDCTEALPPKIKSSMSQKSSNRSRGLHKKGKVIRNVLIQPKLPSYSVGRIMDKPDTFVGQIGQPSSFGGRKISNSYLIKIG